MRKQLASLFVAFFAALLYAAAGTLPTVSTGENEVWYFIQFMNGGKVINASAAGGEITVNQPTGVDSEWFKLTGDAASGYEFTSKNGLKLYTTAGAKENKLMAAAAPTGKTLFKIVACSASGYSDGFEVVPAGNTSLAINLWGGPSDNRGAGLWNVGDQNNAIRFVSKTEYESAGKYALIPMPASMQVTKDGTFDVRTLTAITYPNDEAKAHAESFAAQLKAASGIVLNVTQSTAQTPSLNICLITDASLSSEGYALDVTDAGISLRAASSAGFFYGLNTLRQLLPRAFFKQATDNAGVEWTLPFISIQDAPLLGHRGFMLDCARHFFSVEEVKRVLDIMSLYKLNRLHWHLTDDQGWRVEIPEYPLLTEVGSIRSSSFSNPGDGTVFYDDTEYGRGMWYSQQQLRDIVAYAKARHIEIIPEIDMPGHMVAAITAYPSLSCDSTKTYSVRILGGISHDVLNVGSDKVIDFLKCVLDNIAGIFPYPYIHIGGDECPTEQWATNAECLKRVSDEGLTGVEQLQSWLVEQLGIYLKEKHGKDLIVWDELLSHWNDANETKPVIMAWNSINKSATAADHGMKSIVVPYQSLYFDMMQIDKNNTVVDEPYFGGWSEDRVVNLPTVYNFNPLASLGGREDYCLGVQGNLWTETTNDSIELEYQLLPRMLALSEIAWLENGKKDWTGFLRRMQSHDDIFDALGYTYAKHYFEPAELTDTERTLQEAESILKQSIRGGVGFSSAELYDVLANAYESAKANPSEAQTLALQTAIADYKAGNITQPVEGKTYRIVSQSSYYKKQYIGSTMYVAADGVRFHYTPQTEPEELWQFTPNGTNGFFLSSKLNGNKISMPTYNAAVKLTDGVGTAVRIDRASIASGTYSYIPGSVTISATAGYSALATGSVKRLHANATGLVYSYNEPALCYPGTWRIEEVTDFKEWLEGLCHKCEITLLTANPEKAGEPSQAALDFLSENIILPAREALKGTVDEACYQSFLDLYNQFLAMPRASFLDTISEGIYYRIQNAYFTEKYAAANASSGKVEPASLAETSDAQLWRIEKQADGTACLVNKATGGYAYITSAADGSVLYGNGQVSTARNAWTLTQLTTDQGATGIAIVETTGVYSWYTNPSAFASLIMKPKDYGASIWNFIETNVTTGIRSVNTDNQDTPAAKANIYYDLSGRRVVRPTGKGIYIVGGRKIAF